MGLFSQDIKVGLSNGSYVVEKVTTPPINKSNVELYVAPGTVACIGRIKLKGMAAPYKMSMSDFTSVKNGTCDIFLYPDKMFDNISVQFFGGQHEVSLSAMPTAKAKFSIVGTATIELSDYLDLATYFNRTITKQDVVDEINKNYRTHLTNEVSAVASKYITPETTEVTLQASLNQIVEDVMSNSRKTTSVLFSMGLAISQRGISMHLNALDDADEKFKLLNEALMKSAIDALDPEKQHQRETEKEREARQFELDKIKAQNTTIIKDESPRREPTVTAGGTSTPSSVVFCTECGAKITSLQTKFCPNCGTIIKR
ncbi:MAG: zinc ribbon domain-containing protein [Clostridia bacterium]|nr:zinc ribbon domain-containing protein [Clostridia bacterium]